MNIGRGVVWVDYDAAVSMHRVLTTNAKERRARRLETPTPADNRCPTVVQRAKSVFENVGGADVARNSVVYVLPELATAQRLQQACHCASPCDDHAALKTGAKPGFLSSCVASRDRRDAGGPVVPCGVVGTMERWYLSRRYRLLR